MDIEKMTEALKQIIMRALRISQEHHHPEIGTEHVLAAMLEDDGLNGIWQRIAADKEAMAAFVQEALGRLSTTSDAGQPAMSPALNTAYGKALDYRETAICLRRPC